MLRYLLLTSLFIIQYSLFVISASAQVPKFGNDTLLDVACWNLEWFGDASNGPSNEQLQFNNIKQVLNNTDIDVWGLCEMSNTTTFQQLLADLPQYAGALATFSQTQKTALLYKKSLFDLISVQHVLNSSSYNYNFASRPPLEVILKTKPPLAPDTLYFVVIHLKAFADQSSYDRRKASAASLKTDYLDAYRKNNQTIVLGDWNDDVDVATYNNLETPFKNLLDDTANYFFTTKQLSDAGKKSYAFINGSMIDHILINNPLKPRYVMASSKVLDIMPSYISNFSNNTSDHFPVMANFNFKKVAPVVPIDTSDTDTVHTSIKNELPVENIVSFSADGEKVFLAKEWTGALKIYYLNGKLIEQIEKRNENLLEISVADLPRGIYVLHLQNADRARVLKMIK